MLQQFCGRKDKSWLRGVRGSITEPYGIWTVPRRSSWIQTGKGKQPTTAGEAGSDTQTLSSVEASSYHLSTLPVKCHFLFRKLDLPYPLLSVGWREGESKTLSSQWLSAPLTVKSIGFHSLSKAPEAGPHGWDLKCELKVQNKKGTAERPKHPGWLRFCYYCGATGCSLIKWGSKQFIFYNSSIPTCQTPPLHTEFSCTSLSPVTFVPSLGPHPHFAHYGVLSIIHIKWPRIPMG